MCFDDYEPCQRCEEEIRKACKKHKCVSCNNGIRKGERYTNVCGIFDGHWFHYKVCGACELDRYRIHLQELADGCPDWSSWCAPEELVDYRRYSDMEHSGRRDGQRYFDVRRSRLEWWTEHLRQKHSKTELART